MDRIKKTGAKLVEKYGCGLSLVDIEHGCKESQVVDTRQTHNPHSFPGGDPS
jgi:hypothetical protein